MYKSTFRPLHVLVVGVFARVGEGGRGGREGRKVLCSNTESTLGTPSGDMPPSLILPRVSVSLTVSPPVCQSVSVSLSVSQSPSCCCGEEDKHEEAADPLFISSGLARCRHTQFTHDTRREQGAGRLPTFVVMEGAVCAHSRHVAVPVNHSQQTLFVSRVAKQGTSGASLVRSNCFQVQLAQLSLLPPDVREDQSSACTARPC